MATSHSGSSTGPAWRDSSWWYWAATALLLMLGVAGLQWSFSLAIALSAMHLVQAYWREPRFEAMAVQVRLAFVGMLVLAAWPPFHFLFWIPMTGTFALVLFGYCALARLLSLMPWNRRSPLSAGLIWRTFTVPPSANGPVRSI